MIPEIALVAAINIWIAWRYSDQVIGPDESLFLMWGMTGARPYLDYMYAASPTLNTWFWILCKITGRRLRAVKFLHHLTLGGLIVLAMVLNHSLGLGLMATTFLHGGRFFGFQSWWDSAPAILYILAFSVSPWIGVWLIGIATLANPKAAVPGAIYLIASGAWLPLLAGISFGLIVTGLVFVFARRYFDAFAWNMQVIRKMHKARHLNVWSSWTIITWMLAFMDIGFCLMRGTLPIPVLITAVAFILLETYGRVWLPNHFMWLAIVSLARPDPFLAGMVLLADMVSSNFYLGNVWKTVYASFANSLLAAKVIGEGLRNKAGRLWVNTWHNQIYIYSQKRPAGCMVEYIEADRRIMPKLAALQKAQFKASPPDWVVQGVGAHDWDTEGYTVKFQIEDFYLLG